MKANLPIAGVFAAAAVIAASSQASAAGHANGFGEKGQLILSADRLVPLLSYSDASITRTVGGRDLTDSSSGSGLSLLFGRSLAPGMFGPVNVHAIPRAAFDITVIRSLTIGGAFALGFGLGGTNKVNGTGSDAPTVTAVGLVPRVGYVFPLGDSFAFWPRAGLGFYSVSTTLEVTLPTVGTVSNETTDTLFSLDLDPQFAIIPTEHFFILAGPLINIPISGSRAETPRGGATTTTHDASLFNFGLTASIGGWLNIF